MNDIDANMKPGRDLDITVALEVMGYIWLKHLLQFSAELAVKWLGTVADLKESSGMYIPVPDSQFVALKEREDHAAAVPNFSTAIEAATQVVDRMTDIGYEYHLETKTQHGTDIYYVYFPKIGSCAASKLPGFQTLPEAIVKAALHVIRCNK